MEGTMYWLLVGGLVVGSVIGLVVLRGRGTNG